MKTITKNVLKKAANNLMFEMEESQYDTLLEEFKIVLQQIDFLSDIEGIDNVDPMTFPFDVQTTYLREDVAEKPLNKKEALKNASDVENGQITLPKVVG